MRACMYVGGREHISQQTYLYIPNKSVDFGHVDVIELLHGLLNLWLVGSEVYNKHQCIVVFDLLHCTLGGQRVFDDVILVQPGSTGNALARIFRPSLTLECLGTVEVYRGVYFSLEFRVGTFQHGLLSLQGLSLGLSGLTRRGSLTYREGESSKLELAYNVLPLTRLPFLYRLLLRRHVLSKPKDY